MDKQLYTNYVRPHLEYAVATWSPYKKEDKFTLEKVKRRATRVIKSLEGLSYEERLLSLDRGHYFEETSLKD